jgi:FAD dependent oxidoreductase TIGR03364
VSRVLVVGGGILGTAHAWAAVRRGHEVLHLERERQARGATVRNFGLIWVSGRSAAELPAALRARELWEGIGADVPAVGFRAIGSLTVARTDAELAVAKEALGRADAGERGFALLDADAARARNPALRGDFLGALWCPLDAAVESRVALPPMRARLAATGRYTFRSGVAVVDARASGGAVTLRDDTGGQCTGDVAILCPGATLAGLVRRVAGDLPVRRVRLQMAETAPLAHELPTALADADSFRYYPAYAGPALDRLRAEQPQAEVAAAHRMQLLAVQRLDGGLTIGDTHAYDEPFGFSLDEAPYAHLLAVAEALLGAPLPPLHRRWSGVYAESTTGELVHRAAPDPLLWVVTGPGGRGMTLSPALGEETADLIGL